MAESSDHSTVQWTEYEPDEKPEHKPEDVARFFFEAFRVYIANIVDWRDLVMTFKYFDIDQRTKFKQVANTRKEDVLDEIFDEIERMTQHDDRFVVLVEVFKECGYDKIVSILEGKIIPQEDAARKLIHENGKLLCDNLLVIELLPSLVAKSIITQKDSEYIRAKEQFEGKWVANFELLFLLPTKSKSWFHDFMVILLENNQSELAEKIDKHYVERLQKQVNQNDEETLMEEYLMSCQPVEPDERLEGVHQEVLRKCFNRFIEDLDPNVFLDKALEHGLHTLVSSRDIRDIGITSEKTRAIIEHVRKRGFNGYKQFKKCLFYAGQTELIRTMDETEATLLCEGAEEGEVRENIVSDYVEGVSMNNLSPYKPSEYDSVAIEPEAAKMSLDFNSLVQDGENVSVTEPVSRQSLQSECRSDASLQSMGHVESFSSLLNFGGQGERQQVRMDSYRPQQGANNIQQPSGDWQSTTTLQPGTKQQPTTNQQPGTDQKLGGDRQPDTKQRPDTNRHPDMNLNDLARPQITSIFPDRDQTELKKAYSNTRVADKDRTEPKQKAEERTDEGNHRATNLQGLIDNSQKPSSKQLKDKKVINREQADMNITEAEIMPVHDDERDDDVDDVDISLRDYQVELAEPAIRGKNVIIVAPTGSGKTRVALRIIQEHIRQQKGKGIAKVIFLVNQVALANQQGEECRKQLPHYTSKVISGESQRSKSERLRDFIDRRDILIVTAQVLLDGLVQKEINGINAFSLMVFDECHHTHANHAFNQIMGMYMQLKFSEEPVNLPQIVGLTASVGVGKAKNIEKAIGHIKSLMANLDAEVISTVNNNMEELRTFVSLPDEETCTVPGRQNDVFGDNVTKLMKTIEQRMGIHSVIKEMPEATQFEAVLKSPAKKGNAQYTQWVSKLVKETAKLEKQEARRFLFPLRAHLEYYNNALIIHNDARVEDALNYLDGEMSRWKENARMDENEKLLCSAYEKIKTVAKKDNGTNPKLKKLEEMILKAYRGEERKDSRGIVFVKTRDLAVAIVSWMKETPGLRELNPTQFLGQNQSSVKGMTKAEQDDALKYFRDGKHKLIVATSVAEEGLDISKCNLVIRYDHVTNEIAMVQSRGRGRAQDSKYIVIAESGTGMAEKEELNMIREILMRKAIIKLQDDIRKDPAKFREELHRFQDEANLERQLKARKRKGKIIRNGEFELRCFRCDQFICMSSDVKKIENAHHVIIDESVKERVKFMKTEPMKYIDNLTQLCGKQICKNCGENLGPICIYRTLEFAVAKVEKFLIVDINGRQDNVKKWKSAPFVVTDLSLNDLKEIMKIRDSRGDL